MPLTTAPDWNTLQNKPTTVAGFGISDFTANAITAQASLTVGGIGTYFTAIGLNGVATNVAATIAGSSLFKVNSGSVGVTAGLTGTWRNVGPNESGNETATLVRIA